MQFPRVNINGTSGDTLLDENETALKALCTAIEHLQNVTVHGRDYQTLADRDAAGRAIHEHRERLAKLRSVEEDLTAIILELRVQMGDRDRG